MPRKKRNRLPTGPGRNSKRAAWNNRALSGLRALARPLAPASERDSELAAKPPRRLSFRDLVEDIAPLAEAELRSPPLSAVPAGQGRPLAGAARLWVQETHGHLQARSVEVLPQLLVDLQRGKIPPRAQVDLHGFDAAQARQELNRAVSQCRSAGRACLLVVYGRGLHSDAGGPVLPDLVAQHLSEVLAGSVLAFCTAPRRWGGLGALLVCLRLNPGSQLDDEA